MLCEYARYFQAYFHLTPLLKRFNNLKLDVKDVEGPSTMSVIIIMPSVNLIPAMNDTYLAGQFYLVRT